MINITFYHDAVLIKASTKEYNAMESFLILHDMEFCCTDYCTFTVLSPDYLLIRDLLNNFELNMSFEDRSWFI